MNRSSLNSQKSISKPKRGLSLSLQKKHLKINNQNQQQTLISKNHPLVNPTNKQSQQNSGKKNRIKYVQGYKNKNQKVQRFEGKRKQNFFKIIDQDIKLGGKKSYELKNSLKQNQKSKNNVLFNNTMSFSNPNSVLKFNNHNQNFSIKNSIQSQRRILRESKVINLHSQNLNYFQKINFSQIDNKEKSNKFAIFSSTAQQLIKGPEALFVNIHQPRIIQTQIQSQSALKNQPNQNNIKIISPQFKKMTLQKLKNVQRQLDKLLQKAYQTRILVQNQNT